MRPDMDFQVTIRYGNKSKRYLTLAVAAQDVASALRIAADEIPEDVVTEADLVELRHAPDFERTLPGSDDAGSGEDSGGAVRDG